MNNEPSATAPNSQPKTNPDPNTDNSLNTSFEDQPEGAGGGWRETFRMALDRARKHQKPRESRQEMGRDRTKAFIVLVSLTLVLLLLFFGLFSKPNTRPHLPGENPHRQPSLGQRLTPGQGQDNSDPSKAVTPMLSADIRANDPNAQGQVTPEDIDRTSRTGHLPKPSAGTRMGSEPPDYALSRVDYSDPLAGKGIAPAHAAQAPATDGADLKKPSLVFVRSTQANPVMRQVVPQAEDETLALPAGTRLLARLQAPVSSAVATPVVAVIEYNYERDGQIVMPAGAKVLGRLTQVGPSGDVAIQFNRAEMLDGTSEKLCPSGKHA